MQAFFQSLISSATPVLPGAGLLRFALPGAWAIILACGLMWLGRRWPSRVRLGLATLVAVVTLLAGPWSPAYYLSLAFQMPSLMTLLICVGWAVYALTYAAFGLASDAWQAWALMVVYGTYYGLTEPAEKALVRELSDERERGRAFGFYNFISGASAIPAGLLTGWLWQSRGAETALLVGAGCAVVAAALLIVWNRRRRSLATPA